MLSLFSTSSEKAGFRLQYMEVFNWGTFDKKVFRISPQGNNSLLTGANASGKSTYIDALLTLMVPTKRNRFYNQSSGVEKKGDRTEKTYVLGHFGNIQEEGKSSTSTQKLRNTDTYSVILAHFKNTDEKKITLFQVRWFSNNELKRQFGIAHIPLDIKKDFSQFDAKGDWKKRLKQIYNANSVKKKIEFIDGPTTYAQRMSKLLGMRSEKALSLFNQVVGVKVLNDLDEFIKTNMLEEYTEDGKNSEEVFLELKSSFDTLINAKNNIEKAKEQINQLRLINDIANKLQEIKEELQQLENSKETALYWFAQKGIQLGEQELEKCKTALAQLNEQLTELRIKEEELKQSERKTSIAIEKDEVGSKIKDLEKEIKQDEVKRDKRKKGLNEYNKIAQKIKLNPDPSKETFIANREKAKQLKQSTKQQVEVENDNLRALKNKDDKLTNTTQELTTTIQTLRNNNNNIAGRVAEIRDEIIEAIGASKEEIPFVGELVKVKEDELAWELSIERVLHSFALRLIVPPKYYTEVNKYVNNNNLRGKITYNQYEKSQVYLKHFNNKDTIENSLVNKVEVKPKTEYKEWIESSLKSQFDFTCVETSSEFDHYPEMVVTKNGLIKFKKGRHEKDDRAHVAKRKNYVLGWNNKEKMIVLRAELKSLQDQQKENRQAIANKKKEIDKLNVYKDDCNDLFSNFKKYEEIDWQTYANVIQEKTEEKEALEQTNDRVNELQKQLAKVRADLKQLQEGDIENKRDEITERKYQKESIEKKLQNNRDIFEPLKHIDVSAFEAHNPHLVEITYKQFEQKWGDFQKDNIYKINKFKEQKREKEDEVKIKINAFKIPSEEITLKFKDWRSDVNSLPDSTNIDLISEYQKFLETLEKDNLPKFEQKFNEYLQETITNKVNGFRMFFTNWADSIKDNIQHLNDSLKKIDFKKKPFTYIQLEAPSKINPEIKEFKKLLDAAIPNIHQRSSSIDGKKHHFNEHIEPFIAKLGKEEYRRRVMDVRSWFRYRAEEFYKETGKTFKTYEGMGGMSGGEKPQLTYTILCAAISYQFGLTKEGLQSDSFRFIAIDESFTNQDADKATYLMELCKQLHLQFLVVTPTTNIEIVEPYISFIHFVRRIEERHSWLNDMTIEQFKEEKEYYSQ